jgi:hypothetical protein
VTTFRIDDFKGKGVDETLLKLQHALDDSRSPVISGLIQTEHYVTNPLPSEFEEHYEDSDSLRTPIDLDRYQRDQVKLEKLFAEVTSMRESLYKVKQDLGKEKHNIMFPGGAKDKNF